MAQKQSNTLAVFVWLIGLLGCIGFLYPLGFISLIIPLLFWLLGSKYTRNHCESYFNILLTAVIISVMGLVIDKILLFFHINIFKFLYIGLIYFGIMCIWGLIAALNSRRYKPELVVKIF